LKRMLSRTAVALASIGAVVALSATMATAHVTIDTLGPVEQGSFAKLGFSVPNERGDAGTVQIAVKMPQDHPLTFVSVQPKAGWDITTTMRTLDEPVEAFGTSITEVIDTITWVATGDTQVGPGEFELFWISAGQMPTDTDSLTFPTVQTYSSGEEVAWIEPPGADGSEPEHPAPSVQLVAASEGDGSTETTVPVGSSVPPSSDPSTTPASDDSDDSNTLGVIALVVGGLGLIAGVTAIVIAKGRGTSKPPS